MKPSDKLKKAKSYEGFAQNEIWSNLPDLKK